MKAKKTTAAAIVPLLIMAACGSSTSKSAAPTAASASSISANVTTTTTTTSPAATTPPSAGGSKGSAGCDGKLPGGKTTLDVWYHQGEQADADLMKQMAATFNSSQSDVQVNLREIPGADYATTVKGAAASKQLPGVLDADSSYAFNYAWSGDLQPIENCIPAALKSDLLPSIVARGSWAGHQWGVGLVDSGVAMYASKKALTKAGVRIPTGYKDAWTAAEFDDVLSKLKSAGYVKPLDVWKNIGKGEFYPYAYAPVIWSAGGDLIDRSTYKTADGALNSPAVVKAMTEFQGYFKNGYVDDNTDSNAFTAGRSALSWVGFWQYAAFKKALGDDLLVLPLPNYGKQPAGAQGSWQWTMTKGVDPDVAWKWIAFTMQADNVAAMAKANSGVPALQSVLATNDLYGPTGGLALIGEALAKGYSVARPPHPAYATISGAVAQAFQDVIDGKDPKAAMDEAVSTIDGDLKANDFYPLPG